MTIQVARVNRFVPSLQPTYGTPGWCPPHIGLDLCGPSDYVPAAFPGAYRRCPNARRSCAPEGEGGRGAVACLSSSATFCGWPVAARGPPDGGARRIAKEAKVARAKAGRWFSLVAALVTVAGAARLAAVFAAPESLPPRPVSIEAPLTSAVKPAVPPGPNV